MRYMGVLSIIVFVSIGFIKIKIDLRKIADDIKKCEEYRGKLKEFKVKIENNEFSSEIFEYLNYKSGTIQNLIGYFGIAVNYKPPYSNYILRNYQIIINELSYLYDYYSNNMQNLIFDSLMTMDSCILKYIGYVKDKEEKLLKGLYNPFIWLREGIRIIVQFPIFFLYWTGIIKYAKYTKILDNILFKIFSVIAGTLGFLGTIITIVTGYENFINIVSQFIK